MASNRFARIVQVAAVAGALAFAGCGGSSSDAPAKAYEGQWTYSGMGTIVLNLRSDGQYSKTFHNGTVSDPVDWAEKGTYTFTPVAPGGETEGTLALSASHQYDFTGDKWQAVMSVPSSAACSVLTGSPRRLEVAGDATYTYYGPEAAIPSTF